jgi:hypothetical protein
MEEKYKWTGYMCNDLGLFTSSLEHDIVYMVYWAWYCLQVLLNMVLFTGSIEHGIVYMVYWTWYCLQGLLKIALFAFVFIWFMRLYPLTL